MCHLARLKLPADRSAAGVARRAVAAGLERWGITSDLIDSAVLAASELVANAVVHASPRFELLVALEGSALELVVYDQGPRPLHRSMTDAGPERGQLSESGRGLLIIEALSVECGETMLEDGKQVWCRISPPDGSILACGCPARSVGEVRLPSGRSIAVVDESA